MVHAVATSAEIALFHRRLKWASEDVKNYFASLDALPGSWKHNFKTRVAIDKRIV